MGRTAKSRLAKLKQYVKQSNGVFSIERDVITQCEYLYCKPCGQPVPCDRKSQVTQHIGTQKHESELKKFDVNQPKIDEILSKNQNTFNDLCKFLISLNIPFNRLLDKDFKAFISKYTAFTVPTMLWTHHLKDIYQSCIESIREKLKDKFIWISIDETTDRFNHKVANFIVGSLDANQNQSERFFIKYGVFG